jgi:Fe-S-cluster-containing dehydrogenase component
VRVTYTPVFCNHCDSCPLLEAAPECVRRDGNGFVLIDPATAQGRIDLVDLCPFGRVYFNEELNVPQKCTGCAHLIDNGWSEPRCVDACATGALRFGDEEDLREEIERALQRDLPASLSKFGSHVFYLNTPRRWIAGTVADRSINEVIIGATVRVFDEGGVEVACLQTDWAGDFRFYDCDRARYRVRIEPEGFHIMKKSEYSGMFGDYSSYSEEYEELADAGADEEESEDEE